MSDLGGFLRGVKVLDLSQYIPGPMATLFLSDMGAEVLKVEPPHGDEMQRLGPRDSEDRPIFYRTMNAGKTVMRMDLKDAAMRAKFLDMVRTADVVVEGFRPGVMKRLGIDYPALKQANPAVILCSISGYGANSSDASKAGHDANYLAMMGMLDRNGGDRPAFFDPPISDVAGSLFAAMIILGALHGRNRTGRGCEIDLALADTVMPLQMMQVADYGANRTVPRRGTTYLNGGAAYYQVYRTRDGRFAILGAVERKFWRAFCEAAGRPGWLERHGDAFPQDALKNELQEFFGGLDSAEAIEKFGSADCCFTIVRDLGEALNERHIEQRMLVRNGPTGELQSLLPAWINGEPPELRAAPAAVMEPPVSANGAGRDRMPERVDVESAANSKEEKGSLWP